MSNLYDNTFFFFQKNTHTNKQNSTSKFIQIYVFFLQTTNVRALYFSTQRSAVRVVFKCKLCLKNSIKLMILIFLWPPGRIFYLSPAFPETRVLKMALKNVHVDILDEIVNKYNNTYHRTIKMKSVDVKPSIYTFCL